MMATSDRDFSDCRQRLLPALIDDLSTNNPARVFVSYQLGTDPKDGYRDVTYRELATAIHRCSWWLEQVLGRSESFETLSYFGRPDLRCVIILYGAIKTGHKLFLSSISMNNLEEHLKLLEDLECRIMLTSDVIMPIAESILSRRTMRTFTAPTLDELLMPGEVSSYPYTKTYSMAKDEPFVVLHTSGSSGLPKPVTLNHGTVSHHDLFLRAPSLGGKPLNLSHFSGKRVLIGLPLLHSAAMCFLTFSIYSDTTPVLTHWPLSAETINQAHLHARVDSSFLLPNLLTEIAKTPEYMENIKSLRYLTFGGSSLSREVGNKLKDLTHLFVSFGTTEAGFYPLEETDREDWEYASFSPIMGYELRPFSEGLYEFVFVRDDDLEKSQGIFSTFPALKEYSVKDLYSKHPTKEGLWLYEGRADDAIAFSNGWKINPSEIESILNGHPAVNSTIVSGHGRTKPALLIEARCPPKTEQERFTLLAEIWPMIEVANKTVPSHGHIAQDLVLFTSMEKPMLRGAKGSVQRKMTVELYGLELDRAYDSHGRALYG